MPEKTVPGAGLEPARGKPPQDFKSCVSASSTTPAWLTYYRLPVRPVKVRRPRESNASTPTVARRA